MAFCMVLLGVLMSALAREPFPELSLVKDLLEQWPATQVEVPDIANITTGSVERLDYNKAEDRERARLLRKDEVPFILLNYPDAVELSEKWTDEYLADMFGDRKIKLDKFDGPSFNFYGRGKQKKKQTTKYSSISEKGQYKKGREPWSAEKMTYKNFVKYSTKKHAVEDPHYYWLLPLKGYASMQKHPSIPDDISYNVMLDLKIWWHGRDSFVYFDQESEHSGIGCRFGMPGVFSTAHMDGGPNMVAVFKGQKRFMVSPPEYCPHIYPYPSSHPESRHTKVDYKHPDYDKYPLFKEMRATQVVLQPGEVFSLPAQWLHFVVNVGQEVTAQCNVWAGHTNFPGSAHTLGQCVGGAGHDRKGRMAPPLASLLPKQVRAAKEAGIAFFFDGLNRTEADIAELRRHPPQGIAKTKNTFKDMVAELGGKFKPPKFKH